jgi:hypothetical protein
MAPVEGELTYQRFEKRRKLCEIPRITEFRPEFGSNPPKSPVFRIIQKSLNQLEYIDILSAGQVGTISASHFVEFALCRDKMCNTV